MPGRALWWPVGLVQGQSRSMDDGWKEGQVHFRYHYSNATTDNGNVFYQAYAQICQQKERDDLDDSSKSGQAERAEVGEAIQSQTRFQPCL